MEGQKSGNTPIASVSGSGTPVKLPSSESCREGAGRVPSGLHFLWVVNRVYSLLLREILTLTHKPKAEN